eukprot:7688597-Karenia_brevis.AAC.1
MAFFISGSLQAKRSESAAPQLSMNLQVSGNMSKLSMIDIHFLFWQFFLDTPLWWGTTAT